MIRRIFVICMIMSAGLILGLQGQVQAQGQAQANVSADAYLDTLSKSVLESVAEHKSTYKQTPSLLEDELRTVLDTSVDFEAFAKGVMGKYYAQATAEQRTAFVGEFKTTLVSLYASALVAADIDAISVEETKSSASNSASVAMKATSQKGQSYQLQYSMRADNNGQWLIRNIILDGVNIGLTYRNQFMSAMDSENGDLARVVSLWPDIIEGQ